MSVPRRSARSGRKVWVAGGRLLILLLASSLQSSCAFPGTKLLRMEVEHEGEVVLTTLFDVPDTSSASEMWEAAGREPSGTEPSGVSLRASESDPLQLRLEGAVELVIRWVDSVETRAALTGLTLIRASSEAEGWHLPPVEVRRAQEAAQR